jgi:hypothetical protein
VISNIENYFKIDIACEKSNDKKRPYINEIFFHLISYEIRTFIQKTRKKSNYIHISTPTTYFPLHMKKFCQPIEL